MTEAEFYKAQGLLEAGVSLNQESQVDLMAFAELLLGILEESDQDDYYSTEGWRHVVGWD